MLATGASLSASDLPNDPGVAASLARYLESRSARFIDWLPDGSMIVATRFGETEQIHRLRSPLSMREQLSFEPDGVIAAAAEPEHGDAFVYLSPRMGGQGTALLLRRAAGQAALALTDGSFRDGAALWAHDGTRIVFSSNRAAGTVGMIKVLKPRISAHSAMARVLRAPRRDGIVSNEVLRLDRYDFSSQRAKCRPRCHCVCVESPRHAPASCCPIPSDTSS